MHYAVDRSRRLGHFQVKEKEIQHTKFSVCVCVCAPRTINNSTRFQGGEITDVPERRDKHESLSYSLLCCCNGNLNKAHLVIRFIYALRLVDDVVLVTYLDGGEALDILIQIAETLGDLVVERVD